MPSAGRRWSIGVVVGILSAAIGVVPWLRTGARLPLQNLWADAGGADAMPFALLPLSQYQLTAIPGILVMGAALAGFVARLVRSRWALSSIAVWIGLTVTQGVVIVQSAVVLARGLGFGSHAGDARASIYFAGIVGGTVVCGALAQAAFWLVSRRAVAASALGLGLSAVPIGAWIALWSPTADFEVVNDVFLNRVSQTVEQVATWSSPVIAGVALGWCGIRPVRRAAVWIGVLLVLWLAPSTLTALSYSLGSRALYGDPREMIDSGREVFRQSLGLGLAPVIVAAIIAVAVAVLRALAMRGVARGGRSVR